MCGFCNPHQNYFQPPKTMTIQTLLIENSVGTTFFSSLIVSLGGLRCSQVLHNALLHSNLRWAMEMFDITPLGRIVNRFSKDIDTIDNVLPFNIRVVISQAYMVKRKQKCRLNSTILIRFTNRSVPLALTSNSGHYHLFIIIYYILSRLTVPFVYALDLVWIGLDWLN